MSGLAEIPLVTTFLHSHLKTDKNDIFKFDAKLTLYFLKMEQLENSNLQQVIEEFTKYAGDGGESVNM